MTLSIQEMQQLLQFLIRTQLSGNESIAHANLVVKLQTAISEVTDTTK